MNWTCPTCQHENHDDLDWNTETVACAGCGGVFAATIEEHYDPASGEEFYWWDVGDRVEP
jgi:transcription elongation factor Elf1